MLKVIKIVAIIAPILEEKLNQIPGRIVSVINDNSGDWTIIYESDEVEPQVAH